MKKIEKVFQKFQLHYNNFIKKCYIRFDVYVLPQNFTEHSRTTQIHQKYGRSNIALIIQLQKIYDHILIGITYVLLFFITNNCFRKIEDSEHSFRKATRKSQCIRPLSKFIYKYFKSLEVAEAYYTKT